MASGLLARQSIFNAVSDSLLRGLTHTLSNRATTLGAVANLLDSDEVTADELVRALTREAERLEEIVRLLRMLPSDRSGTAEPMRLPELLAEVVALHEHHCELRDVPCRLVAGVDVPPVWIERSTLTHALLVLLTAAKRDALAAGGGALSVRCSGDHARVSVLVEAHAGGRTNPVSRRTPLGEPLDVGTLRELLAEVGAELVVTQCGADGRDGGRYELRLPTLVEVRRRERAQEKRGGQRTRTLPWRQPAT